jgi:hypothetical protein
MLEWVIPLQTVPLHRVSLVLRGWYLYGQFFSRWAGGAEFLHPGPHVLLLLRVPLLRDRSFRHPLTPLRKTVRLEASGELDLKFWHPSTMNHINFSALLRYALEQRILFAVYWLLRLSSAFSGPMTGLLSYNFGQSKGSSVKVIDCGRSSLPPSSQS